MERSAADDSAHNLTAFESTRGRMPAGRRPTLRRSDMQELQPDLARRDRARRIERFHLRLLATASAFAVVFVIGATSLISVPVGPRVAMIARSADEAANIDTLASAEDVFATASPTRVPIEQMAEAADRTHSAPDHDAVAGVRKEVWQLRGIDEILPEWNESHSIVGQRILQFRKTIPDELWVSESLQCGPDDYVARCFTTGKGMRYTIIPRVQHPDFFAELDRMRALEALPEYVAHAIEQTRLAREFLDRREREKREHE